MKTTRWILLGTVCWVVADAPVQAFYNPQTGRWLNRDPAEEEGGPNPYAMLKNGPVSDTDSLGLWNWKVHRRETIYWAGLFFTRRYSEIIGTEDDNVDWLLIPILIPGRSSLGPEQSRHMRYLVNGRQDSREWWYRQEFENATNFLTQADREHDVSLCADAARAFGRGLHSVQDRSAHRAHPRLANWPAGRNHPGWWDAWEDADYTAYGFSDEYWRTDINEPPLWYPWAEGDIQQEQRRLQEAARLTVIDDSLASLREFSDAVLRGCVCRRVMIPAP